MSSRSAVMCAASIAETVTLSRRTRLTCIAVCNSSSVGITGSVCARDKGRSVVGLLKQDVQRRHVVVPLNQSGDSTEARNGFPVERPDFLADARAVIVDAQGASVRESLDAVSGQMDFADGFGRQGGDIGRGIPAMVMGADADIVDVAKDAAAGTGCDSGHELPFRNDGVAEGDVG